MLQINNIDYEDLFMTQNEKEFLQKKFDEKVEKVAKARALEIVGEMEKDLKAEYKQLFNEAVEKRAAQMAIVAEENISKSIKDFFKVRKERIDDSDDKVIGKHFEFRLKDKKKHVSEGVRSRTRVRRLTESEEYEYEKDRFLKALKDAKEKNEYNSDKASFRLRTEKCRARKISEAPRKIKMSDIEGTAVNYDEFNANSARGQIDDGVYSVYSYGTKILSIDLDSGKVTYWDGDKYSQTTSKVQNALRRAFELEIKEYEENN